MQDDASANSNPQFTQTLTEWKKELEQRGLFYPPEQIESTPSLKSISYTELEIGEWPEDIFIEGGILSRGDAMLLAAESKAGKSTLLCGMIRQLISGGNFLGFKVTRPLKVLYMQAEVRETRLKQRLEPTYRGLTLQEKGRIRIWSTRGLVLLSNREQLQSVHDELSTTRPDVLVVDPMINFHNFNENDAQEMTEFFRTLDFLKEKYNMALILSQHFRKPNIDPKLQGNLLDMIRGSTSLRGWAVTTVAMEGRTATDYRKLYFETRNSDDPIERIIKYNKETKDFDWHDPTVTVAEWLISSGVLKDGLSTNDLIDTILDHHGKLFSNNRSKVFQLKELLINTNVICVQKVGKKHVHKLSK